MATTITEETGKDTIEQWFDEARKQTPETFPAFMQKLANDYQHDYGTICHASAAAAVGAAWAMDKSPQGGITGFQAGCIMWEFVRRWLSIKGPVRLVQFSNMLYPQYEYEFERTIPESTHKWLRDEANRLLADSPDAHPDVIAHWKRLADGAVPFGFVVKDH